MTRVILEVAVWWEVVIAAYGPHYLSQDLRGAPNVGSSAAARRSGKASRQRGFSSYRKHSGRQMLGGTASVV